MTALDPNHILAGLQLGIIDHIEIINWADRRIVELPEPPYWLIELSMSSHVNKQDLESILRSLSSLTIPSDNEFLGAMAVRMFDLNHHLRDILPMMYERFCISNRTDAKEERGMIYLIDDEFDWQPERGIETAKVFLLNYLPEGRALLNHIKS